MELKPLLIRNPNSGITHRGYKDGGKVFTAESCNLDDLKGSRMYIEDTEESRAEVKHWCGVCCPDDALEAPDDS